MPVDVGSQNLSLKFGSSGSSANINRRFVGIRPTGIYSGGYLTVVDTTHASISALVCEITDSTHQVRIATTAAVNLVVSSIIPYIVLRWTYTGDTSDYMELLAIGSGTLQDNDIIVGKCTFTGGGLLNGFTYDERTNPNTFDNFLKVEPTVATELRVRIRAGRIQSNTANIDIDDQLSSVFVVPATNSRIDLVYITSTGAIAIDSSGTAAATPVAPSYGGKMVLAEVTVAATSTNITASMIKDVRNFIASVKTDCYLTTYNAVTQLSATGIFSKADLGTTKKNSGITRASNRITLAANRKYALSYAVSGQPTAASSGDPLIKAKWAVISGDTSWDLETVSESRAECADEDAVLTSLSNTCYFIPSSETVLELQLYTEGGGQKAQIDLVTTNIMSID